MYVCVCTWRPALAFHPVSVRCVRTVSRRNKKRQKEGEGCRWKQKAAEGGRRRQEEEGGGRRRQTEAKGGRRSSAAFCLHLHPSFSPSASFCFLWTPYGHIERTPDGHRTDTGRTNRTDTG